MPDSYVSIVDLHNQSTALGALRGSLGTKLPQNLPPRKHIFGPQSRELPRLRGYPRHSLEYSPARGSGSGGYRSGSLPCIERSAEYVYGSDDHYLPLVCIGSSNLCLTDCIVLEEVGRRDMRAYTRARLICVVWLLFVYLQQT